MSPETRGAAVVRISAMVFCLSAGPVWAQQSGASSRAMVDYNSGVALTLWILGSLVLIAVPVLRRLWDRWRRGPRAAVSWRAGLVQLALVLAAWTGAIGAIHVLLNAYDSGDYPGIRNIASSASADAVQTVIWILALGWLALAAAFWRARLLAPAMLIGLSLGMLSVTGGLSWWYSLSGMAVSDHRVARAQHNVADLSGTISDSDLAQVEALIRRGDFIMDLVQRRMRSIGSTTSEDLARHLAPYGFSIRTLFEFSYEDYARSYVAAVDTDSFQAQMAALQNAGLERSGRRDMQLLDNVRDLVTTNRRYRDLVSVPGRSQQAIDDLTEARLTLAHVTRDRVIMRENQSGKTFWILLIPAALATWLVLVLWHLFEVRRGEAFLRRLSDRALGHLLLFHVLMPVMLVGLMAVAIAIFVGRSDPEIHALEEDTQALVTAADSEFNLARDFVHDETAKFRQIATDVMALERRLVRHVTDEMRIVSSEVRRDYHLVSDGIVNVEREAIDTVKTAVGKEVDKISGMFTLDLGFLGTVDLGIGKMLKSLIPDVDLGLGDFFKGIGTQLITTMEKPFVQPLANLKRLEGQLTQLARQDFDEVKNELHNITRIGDDVRLLSHKLAIGRAELMRDARAMARDFGFFLTQLLWLGGAVLLALVGFVLYLLVGWVLSFALRLRNAIALIMRDAAT